MGNSWFIRFVSKDYTYMFLQKSPKKYFYAAEKEEKSFQNILQVKLIKVFDEG